MRMEPGSRALDKIYKRRDRYDIPDYQREEVWSTPKKQKLIDTVLKRWKLPKFYFIIVSEHPNEYEVVDGQQRLVAIWEFFNDELQLSPASAEEFGGARYSELPEAVADAFDDYEIEYDILHDATEEEAKEFFQRLQGGIPLTSSEKLNSVPSKLRDFAWELARHDFLREKVTCSDRRYGHFDIVCKAAAIEVDGLGVGLRYDDLEGVLRAQASFSGRSQVATRLTTALNFLDRAFQERNEGLRNRTMVQALITLAARLVEAGAADGWENRLASFFTAFTAELRRQVELGQQATDHDYIAFQRTVNANVRSGARTRQQILLRKLLSHDPGFDQALGTGGAAESQLGQQIRADAEAITARIGELNSRYAAANGVDLFKTTNKTVRALNSIGKPVDDMEGYAGLVGHLYFIFHEGPGERLKDSRPRSFRDVNDLRTALQHDLDHGKGAKTKRRKVGKTFGEYCGGAATAPEALAPEVFPAVQARLLQALRADLEGWEVT